jgi:predicted 2-oxoglutarate/Fe(II)-dependent dioxygenase YbiX
MIFIKTIKSFLSKEECDNILNKFLNADLNVAEVGNGKSIEKVIKIRDSKILFTQLPHYKKKLETVLRNEIKIKGFELDEIENFQFTKYELNGHFDWHTDSTYFGYYAKRFCSVVIQLNNEYEGGELLYKDHNDNIVEFKKGVGNLFIFNSSTSHKVKPIIGGERYSLVSWISLKEISNFKKTLI